MTKHQPSLKHYKVTPISRKVICFSDMWLTHWPNCPNLCLKIHYDSKPLSTWASAWSSLVLSEWILWSVFIIRLLQCHFKHECKREKKVSRWWGIKHENHLHEGWPTWIYICNLCNISHSHQDESFDGVINQSVWDLFTGTVWEITACNSRSRVRTREEWGQEVQRLLWLPNKGASFPAPLFLKPPPPSSLLPRLSPPHSLLSLSHG